LRRIFAVLSSLQQDFGPVPAAASPTRLSHISAVERAGLSTLNEGQAVEYELVTGRNGKASAENLKVA
jgi:CspA family cold shock protein